jgi:hypothetical protein
MTVFCARAGLSDRLTCERIERELVLAQYPANYSTCGSACTQVSGSQMHPEELLGSLCRRIPLKR